MGVVTAELALEKPADRSNLRRPMSRAIPDIPQDARDTDPLSACDLVAATWEPELPARPLGLPTPAAMPDARAFLESHRDAVIVGLDWPVILAAAEATRLGRHRDLVQLDLDYPGRRAGRWAEASFRVGRRQLSRLRGARDLRAVQRYLAAVEEGRAQGWNPIVFGIALAAFHLPYRPALLHYAGTLLRGLAQGCRPAQVPERDWNAWMDHLEASLPEAVARLLPDAFVGPGSRRLPESRS